MRLSTLRKRNAPRNDPRGITLSWALLVGACLGLSVPTGSSAQASGEESRDSVREILVFGIGGDSEGASLFGGGYLGLQTSDLTPELREHFGVDREVGVMVSRVSPGSPAERAGIEVGDIILRFAGHAVESTWRLVAAVGRQEADQPLTVELRRGSRTHTLEVRLEQRERTALDVGNFFQWELDGGDGQHVLRFEGPVAGERLHFESKVLESLKDRLEGIDWEMLSRSYSFEISDEATEKRLRALEERLRDIEIRIEIEEHGDPDS